MTVGALVASLYAARIDSYYRVLPNQYTMFILLLGFSNCILFQMVPHSTYFLTTFGHIAVAICLPRAYGMGDAKLFAGLGLFIVDSGVYVLWLSLSYATALLWGVFLRINSIALGPHIVMAWIVCFVGDYAYVSFLDSR